MLRYPIIILFRFLILSFLILNNRFGETSLIDLSLGWFSKFNTYFSLECLQEDMLKFIVEESVSGKLIYYALIYVHVCERCGWIKKLLFKYQKNEIKFFFTWL